MYSASDQRGQQKLAISLELLPNTPPLPVGEFSLIVADPAWRYHLRETDKTHRGRCPYPQMSVDEIAAMPVQSLCAEQAYLMLWTTKDHLQQSFSVMEAWGFTYKSIYTWVKSTKDRSKIRMGIGHYGRNCTEFLLVGTRGKAPCFTTLGLTDIPTAFLAPVGKHSAKPEEFYAIANRLGDALGGPRLELFARQQREGWLCWGAEVSNSIQADR